MIKNYLTSNGNSNVLRVFTHTHTHRKWLNRNFAMLVMFLSTIVFNPLMAQFKLGYPSSEPALSKLEEVWYTDETRANVDFVFDRTTHMEVHLDAGTGRQFEIGKLNVNDKVLLIQMKVANGNAGGWYTELNVNAINGNILELEHTSFTFVTHLLSTDARCQLIKLPRHQSITLDKVVVKCHEWDGYTGGVLAFAAGETLLSNTIITAAGCGFGPEMNGAIGGTGGAGGAGDNVYTNSSGGEVSQYNRTCLIPEPTGSDAVDGQAGEDGEDDGALGSAGSTITGVTSYNYGAPNYATSIVKMGSAGFSVNGFKGGDGGGGGGLGGKGGMSGDNNPGNDGEVGQDGGKGGDAGRGAKGGGIILIKTMYFGDVDPLNSTQGQLNAWLDASGADGGNGKNGFVGGMYGLGGAGGQGSIVGSTVYFSGGNGGNGASGDPSDGGDGSLAGKGGTIFLYTNPTLASKSNAFDFATGGGSGPNMNWINLKSGKNGKGGEGAFGYISAGSGSILSPSGIESSSYENCPPATGATTSYYCNCDMAMYPFANVYESVDFLGTFTTSNGNWSSTYNPSLGMLTTTEVDGSQTNVYICKFFEISDANLIFQTIFEPISGINTRTNNLIEIGKDAVITEPLGTDIFKYNFIDFATKQNSLYYYSNSVLNESKKYLHYHLAAAPYYSIKADTGSCHGMYPGMEGLPQGTKGATVVEPVPDVGAEHFGFNSSMFRVLEEGKESLTDKIITSYHSDIKSIGIEIKEEDANTKQKWTYKILDIQGKQVLQGTIQVGKQTIDAEMLKPGTYILRVSNNQGKSNAYKVLVN